MAWSVWLLLSLLAAGGAWAQRCLVLPFPNRSGDSSLDWLGESFVVGMRTALAGSPVTVLDHQERTRALALLGVPAGADLSLASQIRLARAADARWLVVGWYDDDGAQLTAHAALVDLQREHLTPLATQTGALADLEQLQSQLGWAVRQQVASGPAVAPAAAAVSMPLSAYEDFTRARLVATPAERIRLLSTAAQLAPGNARVLLDLGEAYLSGKQNALAMARLEMVPADAPERPEAEFYSGVAAFQLGQYLQAAERWRSVAHVLPLPAVVNNLAIAERALGQGPSPAAAESASIETAFPADEYRQLARAVADYAAQKANSVPPEERAGYEVTAGDRLRVQEAWTAAAAAYQRAIAAAQPGQAVELGAAHAGLAAIAYARHDTAQALKEVAAALAADPDNAAARALGAKLGAGHEHR